MPILKVEDFFGKGVTKHLLLAQGATLVFDKKQNLCFTDYSDLSSFSFYAEIFSEFEPILADIYCYWAKRSYSAKTDTVSLYGTEFALDLGAEQKMILNLGGGFILNNLFFPSFGDVYYDFVSFINDRKWGRLSLEQFKAQYSMDEAKHSHYQEQAKQTRSVLKKDYRSKKISKLLRALEQEADGKPTNARTTHARRTLV